MAEKKTGAAKAKSGSAAAKKSTAAKKPQPKAPAGKKTNTASKGQKTSASANKAAAAERESRRFWSYILFFFGVFELFVTFIPGGGLWNWLHCFNRGLFGSACFLFAPMIIAVALMIASDLSRNSVTAKVVEGFILMLLLSGIVQIIQVGAVTGDSFWLKIKGLYNSGKQLKGGGFMSAFIGWPLLWAFKRVGAAIVIILVSLLFVLLLTNITLPQLLKGFAKPVVKGYEAVNEDRLRRAENAPTPEELEAIRADKAAKKKARQKAKIDIAKYYDGEEQLEKDKDLFDFWDGKAPAPTDEDAPPEIPVAPVPGAEAEPTAAEPAGGGMSEEEELAQLINGVVSKRTRAPRKPKADAEKAEAEKAEEPMKINVEKNGQTTLFERDEQLAAYVRPPVDLLHFSKNTVDSELVQQEVSDKSQKLVETLETYGAKTRIVGIYRGPSVTRYELQPAAGVRVSKITQLADDIALSLAATSVRIEAPVPGKACIGIEIPNSRRDTVSLRELIDSDEYRKSKGKLTFAVGKDIEGKIVMGDISKMPHVLVAGTTGSGKSVFTNSIILSILYHASPEEVKLILIDPKKVEFPIYNKIPHLLIPVVTEPLKAAGALGWAVNEMNKRYLMFEANSVKNLEGFNEMLLEEKQKPEEERDEMKAKLSPLPQIVIVIDEFADLMMAAKSEVEDSVLKLAQLARAAGIHMIIATQSPRTDVLTGLIKSNIPSRVSLSVASNIDSRVILDESGAEKLLGNGDLLYKPIGVRKPFRIQSGYASAREISSVVEFLKKDHSAEYSQEIIDEVDENTPAPKEQKGVGDENIIINPDDDLIEQAVSIILQTQNASTAFLQRKLKLGFPRAARIMDEIEEMGIIGPQEGSKPRKILISQEEWAEMLARR